MKEKMVQELIDAIKTLIVLQEELALNGNGVKEQVHANDYEISSFTFLIKTIFYRINTKYKIYKFPLLNIYKFFEFINEKKYYIITKKHTIHQLL